MKQNGFTLPELLAVIVIISILVSVAAMGVVNIIDRVSNKNMEQQLQQLSDAAISYALDKNFYLKPCPSEDGSGCSGEYIKVIQVKDLKPDFFEDSANNCKDTGNITLYADFSNNFRTLFEEGICTKD